MKKQKETKGRSPRLGVSVNEEFYAALQDEARRSKRPISTLVRIAIEEYMRNRGWDVSADVEWGGWKGKDAEGQPAAVAQV